MPAQSVYSVWVVRDDGVTLRAWQHQGGLKSLGAAFSAAERLCDLLEKVYTLAAPVVWEVKVERGDRIVRQYQMGADGQMRARLEGDSVL